VRLYDRLFIDEADSHKEKTFEFKIQILWKLKGFVEPSLASV
jgi:hypothetical protein